MLRYFGPPQSAPAKATAMRALAGVWTAARSGRALADVAAKGEADGSLQASLSKNDRGSARPGECLVMTVPQPDR